MKILVIDPNLVAARSIARMLPGDEVAVETDSNAARLRLVDAEQEGVAFAVIVCDVEINSMRGIDILQASRDRSEPPLFLFMATYNRAAEAAWLADGVLLKPFRPDEILNTIAQLMLKRARAITWPMRTGLVN